MSLYRLLKVFGQIPCVSREKWTVIKWVGYLTYKRVNLWSISCKPDSWVPICCSIIHPHKHGCPYLRSKYRWSESAETLSQTRNKKSGVEKHAFRPQTCGCAHYQPYTPRSLLLLQHTCCYMAVSKILPDAAVQDWNLGVEWQQGPYNICFIEIPGCGKTMQNSRGWNIPGWGWIGGSCLAVRKCRRCRKTEIHVNCYFMSWALSCMTEHVIVRLSLVQSFFSLRYALSHPLGSGVHP